MNYCYLYNKLCFLGVAFQVLPASFYAKQIMFVRSVCLFKQLVFRLHFDAKWKLKTREQKLHQYHSVILEALRIRRYSLGRQMTKSMVCIGKPQKTVRQKKHEIEDGQ